MSLTSARQIWSYLAVSVILKKKHTQKFVHKLNISIIAVTMFITCSLIHFYVIKKNKKC